MKKRLFILATTLGLSVYANAQSTDELLKFSRYNFSLSTARSAAMGGAFTSLGADAVSMSLNPAGLAMYSSSEVSISPGLRISATESRYGNNPSTMSNFTKPTLANFAATFKTNGGLVLSIGMNRLADFSGRSYVQGDYGLNSMAYIFRDQLQSEGIRQSTLNDASSAFKLYPNLWNAAMANRTWLVNPVNDVPGNTEYTLDGVLDFEDQVASTLGTRTNGAIDEIALSAAYNFGGVLYVGGTLGMQRIAYSQMTTYSEFANLDWNTGKLDSFELREDLAISGVGVNLKVGATLRPVSWLRIGVAYHSPTWMSLDESSVRSMDTWLLDNSNSQSSYDYTPDLVQSYDNRTPSRLMAGISTTIGRAVILSFDYERTWYNDMKYSTPINIDGWRAPIAPSDIDNMPTMAGNMDSRGNIDLNSMIRNNYRATNNYRAGIEVQPVNGLFLRAGWAYSQSPYQPIESFYNKPYPDQKQKLSDYGSITQYSGGLGYRNGRFIVDLAYIYSTQKTLPSVFYDYVPEFDYGHIKADTSITPTNNNYNTHFNHNVILTLGMRF